MIKNYVTSKQCGTCQFFNANRKPDRSKKHVDTVANGMCTLKKANRPANGGCVAGAGKWTLWDALK